MAPALATTILHGCREVVARDDELRLRVPARNASALVKAIARLNVNDDPYVHIRLGEAARRKVVEEFDERSVIERTVAVYCE